MSDDELRALERAWQADFSDGAARDRFAEALRRAGKDPLEGLVAAAGDAPWAGLVRASVPIVRHRPEPRTFGRRLLLLVWNVAYHVANVDVFEDGAIDAWGFVDRALFAEKLAGKHAPPVVTLAPDGDRISIHNLGATTTSRGQWLLEPRDVLLAVDLILRSGGRPEAELLDMKGEATELRGSVRYSKLGLSDAQPCRRGPGGGLIRGTGLPVFTEGRELVSWLIFEDRLCQLGPAGALVPFEEIMSKLLYAGAHTRLKDGETIVVPGLGSLVTSGSHWFVGHRERIREAMDQVEVLRGGDGALGRARAALAHYHEVEAAQRRDPSVALEAALGEARERLHQAYHSVPAHLCIYLGDMDTRDSEYRRILDGFRR